MDIYSPISTIRGIGPAYVKRLNKLGIRTIRDLLYHFPHRYEDFSNLVKIRDLAIGFGAATVQGKVINIKNIRTWKKRMYITEARVEDDTAAIRAVWFNQPYLIKNIKKGDIVNLSGKVGLSKKSMYLASPAYEVIGRSTISSVGETGASAARRLAAAGGLKHTAGLIPVYPETQGLTSRALRYFIKPLLIWASQIPDILPPPLRRRRKLLDLKTALWQIHFPKSPDMAGEAKRRLAFEEMFLWQLIGLAAKRKTQLEKAVPVKIDVELAKRFTASLPYQLTNSQKVAAWRILQDISRLQPMNRLLQGDVGSGKTVVAALAALMTNRSGGQVAFMAPTEILARQHFQTLSKTLTAFDIEIGLLTSAECRRLIFGQSADCSKRDLIRDVKSGLVKILVGTHALIQKNVVFDNLVLAVVDEQHRFGVEQRAELTRRRRTGETCHLLSMTATPIPRTLALTIYGDLDLTLIKELPPGRQRIVTESVSPEGREGAYAFIREQVRQGRQAFVICPRIELTPTDGQPQPADSGSRTTAAGRRNNWSDVKTVKEEYEKLSKTVFPDLKVAMLHGKMKAEEKQRIMKDFSENKTNVLISTSVVEVGIDIPNATIMMIEGADRFGLAQLYQLRGRVGRGKHQSYCLLFTDPSAAGASVKTSKRLEAMQKCSNGFELAEIDLKLRGPGDFYGIRQWGLPDLTMSSLGDVVLIEAARAEAGDLLDADPELKNNPWLRARVSDFKKLIHFE